MADIPFPKELIDRLVETARRQNLTPAEVLSSLLDQHYPTPQPSSPERDQKSSEKLAREVILRVYERARRYWREHGETEKAAMTDAEMDEQFWLIDLDGIPRLKSEQGQVALPPDPLTMMAEAAEAANLRSGRSDLSGRSGEIYAEHLRRKRMQNAESDID